MTLAGTVSGTGEGMTGGLLSRPVRSSALPVGIGAAVALDGLAGGLLSLPLCPAAPPAGGECQASAFICLSLFAGSVSGTAVKGMSILASLLSMFAGLFLEIERILLFITLGLTFISFRFKASIASPSLLSSNSMSTTSLRFCQSDLSIDSLAT